jgi:xylulokinase
MLVPQPGWAEHRPREDWWGDLIFITRKLLADSKIAPTSIRAMGCSGIGPCMLPVDAAGEPLMDAVLYGVDGRAAKEINDLTERIGADALLDRCGNALTSQAVGPKILWLKHNRPDIYAKTRTIHNSTSYLVEQLTGAVGSTTQRLEPAPSTASTGWNGATSSPRHHSARAPAEARLTTDIAGTVTNTPPRKRAREGTPVIVGTIDAAAEALSVGCSIQAT